MADFKNQVVAIKPDQILEILIRQRWILIIPLCISLTLGFFYALTSPRVYQASTTILIQPQKVPSNYVRSIITSGIEQRINTISQQILSRTNLESIIKEFRLFENQEGLYQEDIISSLRQRVKVTQNSGRSQGTEAFSVSFTGNNPKIVMAIANKLATFFMDENIKVREIQAVGTSDFLESELEKIKRKLENREKELAEYRAAHLGELPDELESNLRTLDRLQIQHSDLLNSLRDTQDAIALSKSQIARLKGMYQNGSLASSSNASLEQQQYESEKRQLDELLLRYTAKHPEVVRLSKSLERLNEKIEKDKQEKDTVSIDVDPAIEFSSDNDVLFQHEFNLRQLEEEVRNIKINISQIKKTMQIYQERVDATPKREQELRSMQRDYNNINNSYNSLLGRRLEAEIAVNMEKKQKGEQFRIIDYARLPEKPISPDVRKLSLFSIAIGLGIGGGIVFLLEFLNPAIRREEQVEVEIGLPILASIPPLERPGDVIKRNFGLILFSIFSLYAGLIFLCFVFLNLKGIDKTIDFVKSYINI